MENVKITEASKKLFLAFAKDACNWSGISLVGGNVGGSKEDCGNLIQLKIAGLVRTFEDDGVWVEFTDKGREFAKNNGVKI